MAELFISKRVIFPRGKQKVFILRSKNVLCLPDIEMAGLLNISSRTLTDWKREKFSMPLRAVKTLSKMTKINIPKSAKIEKPFWYVNKGAKAGGIAVYKKYGIIGGSTELRKRKWRKWWVKTGQFKNNPILNAQPIKKPIQSARLAEFFGIMMGDGGMNTNQIFITLHHKDDREYIAFVIKLINELFGISPHVYHRPKYSVKSIVISRKNLVKDLNSLGLPIGNKIKQQFDIPKWIKKEREYQIACLRGLIDTDGSIFDHNYKVNNKWYCYKKLCFTTASAPLRNSVFKILKRLSLKPRISGQRDVRLDSQKDLKSYFEIIGSSNLKHLKRYKN